MTGATGRRRRTCHHEAGHALVRWYFGHGTDRAVVLTVEEVRAGKLIEGWRGEPHAAEGSVVGYLIHEPPFGPTPQPFLNEALERRREVARDIALIDCAAGIMAEAAYSRAGVAWAGFVGGGGDLKSSREILDAWFPEDDEARATASRQAQQRASALVRSASGAAAIRSVAAALYEGGELSGEEIGELFRSAYGGRECRFGAWIEHWPRPSRRSGLASFQRGQALTTCSLRTASAQVCGCVRPPQRINTPTTRYHPSQSHLRQTAVGAYDARDYVSFGE